MPRSRELAELATSYDSGGLPGMRNRIINGAMVIDQRNNGASVTPNLTYTLDRWKTGNTQTSKFTVQQNAGSVTPPAGFSNYLGVTSSSAYSVTSTDEFTVFQPIEGFNFSDIAWGTANAQTVTVSFWVRSSLTGTFGGALNNSALNRVYPFSYTVSSANTWEYKTVTIAGDTTGTWVGATNGVGVYVQFGLGAGSNNSKTAGSWQAGYASSATGATSVVGTNGATFYITGVQLEKGSTATSFDYRPYGTELALCQRYFQTINAFSGTANATTNLHIKGQYWMPMRGTPSISQDTVFSVDDTQTAFTQSAVSTGVLPGIDRNYYKVSSGNFTGLTIRQAYWELGGSLLFSAEL
jgi:hypothetical protein